MLTALPVDDYGRVAQRGAIFAEVEHPNLMHQVNTFIGPPLTTEESPDARDFGIIYSVADWVPGADLDDAVDGVDARTALGWVGQIAHAVEFLHDVRTDLAPHGIVHRDIKPSNIRITPAGRAVLIDFGVARAFEATDLTSGVGTHLWRAPEVVGGVGEPGPASDAWGIGALAYWVLLREPPPLDSAASARERLVPAGTPGRLPGPGWRRAPHLPTAGAPTGAAARPPRPLGRRARRRRPPFDGTAPGQAGRGRDDGARGDGAGRVVARAVGGPPRSPRLGGPADRRRAGGQVAAALAEAARPRPGRRDGGPSPAPGRRDRQGRRPRLRRVRQLRDRRDAAGPCRQRERGRLQRRWQPGRQLERRRHGPALGPRRPRRRSSPASPSTAARRPWR